MSGYLQGPWFDAVFFLAAPLWSLALGFAADQVHLEDNTVVLGGQKYLLTSMLLRGIIHAHLVIVLFRSHGNAAVRRRHPALFFVVPPLLLLLTFVSAEVLLAVVVLTTYWDNYHSSLQTFGLGRIYDRQAGADVTEGRVLDLVLNLLLYFAPFMAGPIWQVTLVVLEGAGVPRGHGVLRVLAAMQPWCHRALWIGVPVFALVYLAHLVRRIRAGQRLSWQKYALFFTTGVASVWAWGFNAFGQALIIVNVFHAVQYFAIVWWAEKKSLVVLFGLGPLRYAGALAAGCLVAVGALYGFWFAAAPGLWAHGPVLQQGVLALTNTVALLHFWYDGFIWSVRKAHV